MLEWQTIISAFCILLARPPPGGHTSPDNPPNGPSPRLDMYVCRPTDLELHYHGDRWDAAKRSRAGLFAVGR